MTTAKIIMVVGLAVGPVAAWLGLYATVLVRTRPRPVAATPPSQELGPEPPAIAHLLANRWRLSEDAAEATLLDLAARRIVELRQAGSDPATTTIHLQDARLAAGQAAGQAGAQPLLPYEQQVLTRILQLAEGGVVPVTALGFRHRGAADRWDRRLRKAVVADARLRGLSRPRLSGRHLSMLLTAAVLAAAGPVVAVYLALGNTAIYHLVVVAVAVFGCLSSLARRDHGERDTDAGRAAAARWLGLRAWLRGHPELDTLPPASVAVWDRYLAYGAALGATATTSAVLDLGMGSHRLVWSSYGGHWRRVRVRYPRLRPQFGLPGLGLAALVMIVLMVATAPLGYPLALLLTGEPADLRGDGWSMLAVGALLGGYGLLYLPARAIMDLLQEHTVTGQVLWLRPARHGHDKQRGRYPYVHFLALDDGTADTTTAWGMRSADADALHPGDTVRLRVRPWSRRVTGAEVLRPAAHRGWRPARLSRAAGT